MKKMIIFEPAMCCSTGLCGPGVDPELLRISTIINNLERKGIVVQRHNLASNPQAFVDNKVINEILNSDGIDVLPITMVDNAVVKTKSYATNEEFGKFLDISEDYLKTGFKIKNKIKSKDCDCKGGCC